MQAGYSSNPLVKKLGIKEGYRCLILNEPDNYVDLLEEIPVDTEFTDTVDGDFDFIHVFVTEHEQLTQHWNSWKNALKKTGIIWVSWPKQTSQLATDLNGNDVRAFGLAGGLVDTKVCAIDHDWSGLKFMYRKTDR
jgi:hypothetical protein